MMMCSRDSLTAGQVICFTNLSYKSWQLDDGGIPTCSTSDLSDITTNPQYSYLRTVFQELQQFAKVCCAGLINKFIDMFHLTEELNSILEDDGGTNCLSSIVL